MSLWSTLTTSGRLGAPGRLSDPEILLAATVLLRKHSFQPQAFESSCLPTKAFYVETFALSLFYSGPRLIKTSLDIANSFLICKKFFFNYKQASLADFIIVALA